jgi:limonene-1,2-epoxide hydrolase
MNPTLEKFHQFYRQLNSADLTGLDQIYRSDIEFIDPIHHIKGIEALNHYFENMMQDLIRCNFEIHQLSEQDQQAFVIWTMHFQHPRLNKSNTIHVDGVSQLKFDEQVFFHRDYYDVGAMLYEHIPLLGSIISGVRKKITASSV